MKLEKYLKDNRISQADFAKKIGVTPQAIHNYLHQGRLPKRVVALRIMDVTGGQVTLADLWGSKFRAA